MHTTLVSVFACAGRVAMLGALCAAVAACGDGGNSDPVPGPAPGPAPAPAPAPVPVSACGDMNELLSAINAVRAVARSCGGAAMPAAAALSWNVKLASAADAHSSDMATHNFFDHVGSGGSTLAQRVNAAGYSWQAIAENIAAGSSTATATVNQWVNSPGHCQAMMSATYVHVGGACRYNAGAQYGYYWTIDLGKPF